MSSWNNRFAFVIWLVSVAAVVYAQPPLLNPPLNPPLDPSSSPTPPAPPVPVVSNSAMPSLIPSPELLGEQATNLLRELLPHEYERMKKWGLTEKVVSGLDISRDGFKIKTHRRWKTVKHGLWKRYKATLVNPEEELRLDIERLEEAGPGRVRLDVVFVSKLDLEGQLVKWQRNVRLFSLTALADATVQLKMGVELGASLDATRLPPDIVFDVVVKHAELELLDFELRRVSDLRGGAAHQLGKMVRQYAADELEDQRERLVEKLNKKIDKKRDKLRLSFQDLLPKNLRGEEEKSVEDQKPADEEGKDS